MTQLAVAKRRSVGTRRVGDRSISHEQWTEAWEESEAAELPSHSVSDERVAAFRAIMRAVQVATRPNWDGEGSLPVRAGSIEQAVRFIQLLPSTVPAPEVSVDPDGELSLEWDRGRRRVYSVSVGADGTLTYAGLFGYEKDYGVSVLVDSIPQSIRNNLRRVLSDALA